MTTGAPLDSGFLDEISDLADAVVAGRATPSERERLEHLVNGSDDACWAYVRHMHDTIAIHRRLHETRLVAALESCPSEELASPEHSDARLAALAAADDGALPYVLQNHLKTQARRPSLATRRLQIGAWLAMALLIAVMAGTAGWLIPNWSGLADPAPQRIAKVVRSVNPSWTRDGAPETLTMGDWLLTGRYALREGVVQIKFPWGTEVTLEAPAEIEFTRDGARRLWHGQLVAKVSPEDTGFTIDTPTVRVIDLGTEFGISTEPDGGSEVHVFKGAVEARQHLAEPNAAARPITLTTGEANGFATRDLPARQIAFNPRRFSRALRLSGHVEETVGAMRYTHPTPDSVAEGHTESNDALVLFQEGDAFRLPEALPVTATEPGLYTSFVDRLAWLPAGLEVNSYLVHFDPVGSRNDQSPVAVQGSVTFDRPILGLIARGDQLAASELALSLPGTRYVPPPTYRKAYLPDCQTNIRPAYAIRGLSGLWNTNYSHASPAPNDWLRLSEDRRTLTVKCMAGGEADQVRILVATQDDVRLTPAEPPAPRRSQPYHGKPFVVGETIEAEDFDQGGQDVAYYDTSADSLSNVYRMGESVELRTYIIGDRTDVNVSVARAGEWLAYTVDVAVPGTYVVKVRAGSRLGGGLFRFEFGETAATQPAATQSIPVPLTTLEVGEPDGWYEVLESTPIELKSGRQIMRVVMEANHSAGRLGNFDWFRIERVDPETRQAVIAKP